MAPGWEKVCARVLPMCWAFWGFPGMKILISSTAKWQQRLKAMVLTLNCVLSLADVRLFDLGVSLALSWLGQCLPGQSLQGAATRGLA